MRIPFLTGLILTVMAAPLPAAGPMGPVPGYGYGGPYQGFVPPPMFSGMRTMGQGIFVERNATPRAYVVVVHLRGLTPADVQIDARPGMLTVRSSRQQYESNETPGGPQGFSMFSSSFVQRVGLPRDADVAAMRREAQEDTIILTIPRRSAAQGWMPRPGR